MVDLRFHVPAVPLAVTELAARAGAEVAGDGSRIITGVAPLDSATTSDLSFFDNPAYGEAFTASGAGAICVNPDRQSAAPGGAALLLAEDPYRAYALAAAALFPPPRRVPAISPAAHVSAGATIGEDCTVEPGAVIEDGVSLGARCVIGAGAVLRAGVTFGDDCRVGAVATVSHCVAGAGVSIHEGARIGQEGFGFVPDPAGYVPVPQLGRVILGDGADIGANCTIDRGTSGDTVIGEGSRLDKQVHIAHNVRMGRGCVLAGQTGIAGSTILGDHVMTGGQVGILGHLRIGGGVRIAAGSGVVRDVADGVRVGGYPAVPIREWHRQTASLRRMAGGTEGQGDEER